MTTWTTTSTHYQCPYCKIMVQAGYTHSCPNLQQIGQQQQMAGGGGGGVNTPYQGLGSTGIGGYPYQSGQLATEQPKEVMMAEDNVASEELALDGDKMVALAKELENVERKITKGKTISPASMEAGTALVRARWALLGIVQESWAALAKSKADKKK